MPLRTTFSFFFSAALNCLFFQFISSAADEIGQKETGLKWPLFSVLATRRRHWIWAKILKFAIRNSGKLGLKQFCVWHFTADFGPIEQTNIETAVWLWIRDSYNFAQLLTTAFGRAAHLPARSCCLLRLGYAKFDRARYSKLYWACPRKGEQPVKCMHRRFNLTLFSNR